MPNIKLEHINYNGTTYDIGYSNVATQTEKGLMSASDKLKLDTLSAPATYTSQELGLYKIEVDTLGNVSSVSTVTKSDITALGIPGQDTTYTFTTSGSGNVIKGLSISGTNITFTTTNANNYSHPSYTSQESNLYKIQVDNTGHVSSVSTVSKADITNLGIPAENTTYTLTVTGTGNAVTSVALGTDNKFTVTKGATYNNYSHPTYTSQEKALYKVEVDTTGHISSVSTVSKADITNLGIPGENTTYTFTTSGSGNAITGMSISGTAITFNKGATYNNYSHPAYTSQENGLYKIEVDNTGHVSSVSTVTKADITALGIPSENTTYTLTTTGTGNAVTAVSLGTDNKITVTKGASYNNYSHPSYTSQDLGLYKIQVDTTGHVSSVSSVSLSDITGLNVAPSWYGTSNTASTTSAKVVTCTNYVLKGGSIIGVLFTTANTATTPTLNVNSTGAKSIYIGNSTPNATDNVLKWSANTMVYFMYDGTYYRYLNAVSAGTVSQPRGANTWYGTSNTTAATTSKVSTIDNFVLTKGATVAINFSTANTVTNAALTLNVNSTGAKTIYNNNAATSATNTVTWDANETLTFIYDGTGYHVISRSRSSSGIIMRTWTA